MNIEKIGDWFLIKPNDVYSSSLFITLMLINAYKAINQVRYVKVMTIIKPLWIKLFFTFIINLLITALQGIQQISSSTKKIKITRKNNINLVLSMKFPELIPEFNKVTERSSAALPNIFSIIDSEKMYYDCFLGFNTSISTQKRSISS